MEFVYLLKGLILGFSIAAPVGPIGVLCIRRTLMRGRSSGLVSGLGAATADAIYGSIAGFGLTFLSTLIVSQQTWLRLAGGLFLCYLGAKTFVARPADNAASTNENGLAYAYASTFFLTLTNPMTIISFSAIFAGLGIMNEGGDYGAAGLLVLGVFVGSALWWFVLSAGVAMTRTKFNSRALTWVNRIAGMIIAGFGVAALLSVIMEWLAKI